MVSKEIVKKYQPTIGIECHVQLKTKTKLFSGVPNDARDAAPNTLISHICLGMPGALPVLNAQALSYAMRVAFSFNTKPQNYSYFERKHYFYPDLPKGYQITQLSKPIIVGGFVEIRLDGQPKKILINRVQIEEDAGKSTHPAGKNYSLVDLNRAGTPLLEIVSEPDIHSAAEAKLYAKELWLLMRYADVSDADLYHGNMRFDVNVSISQDDKLGLRTETKNLNSFRSVEKAVEYEIQRQIALLEKGQKIVQETRGWDDTKQKTFSQRSKEDAHDYRYFPDPDIPPIVLTDEEIAAVKKAMPILPAQVRAKLQEINIDTSAIETLVESIPAGKLIASLADKNLGDTLVKKVANWLVTEVQAELSESNSTWEDMTLIADDLMALAKMTDSGQVSSTAAKSILRQMVRTGGAPHKIAADLNILQVSDEAEISMVVAMVLQENDKAANDLRRGEAKAIGFLVGQVMKISKGKANPAIAQELIRKQLDI